MHAAKRARLIDLIRSRRAVNATKPRRRMPKQAQPNAIRVAYFKRIRSDVLDTAHAMIVRALVPRLPDIVQAADAARTRGDTARFDASTGDVNRIVDAAAAAFQKQLGTDQLEQLARDFANRTSDFQEKELRKQVVAALGVDVLINDPKLAGKLDGFVSENVSRIKTIATNHFGEIEQAVTTALRNGARADELAEIMQERYGVSESRAMLIAQDQIGKLNANVNQSRQESLGLDGYIWRTMNDNRVRSEHEPRNGKKFLWSEPPSDGHAGEPIRCRCYSEPDFTPIYEQIGYKNPPPIQAAQAFKDPKFA